MSTLASSSEGKAVEQSLEELDRNFDDLELYGVDAFIDRELRQTWLEVRSPNWDGHDAFPVSRSSMASAASFVRRLPLGTVMPEVGAEPDGCLTLDWREGPRRMLSISFSADGAAYYAAMMGPSTSRGMIAPEESLEPILSVLSQIV